MPPGGDGWYFFYIFMRVDLQELGFFEIEVNDVVQCTAVGQMEGSGLDTQQATCGVVALLEAGNRTVLHV